MSSSKENLSVGISRIHCPFENCTKSYQNRNSLLEHYRLYPSHRPASLSGTYSRKRVSARDYALEFLDEKKIVTPAQFLLQGTKTSRDVYKKFDSVKTELCQEYPDLTPLLNQKEPLDPPSIHSDRLTFTELATKYQPQSCEWILEIDNGSYFCNYLMPYVLQSKHDAFLEFCCGIVGTFGMGQREVQDTLRNKWGKKLSDAIGINPILSKDEIFTKLNSTRAELLEKLGLEFNQFGEVVVGYIDIEKHITLFLSQSGVQNAIATPNNSLIIYDYTDGFPWLKWSRHFQGETSVRIKLVEPHNLLSTVLTVALWLGSDDYNTVKQCASQVYKQLSSLKFLQHPITGQQISIIRRSCGDGKERRSSTGNSSAKSTYPIPEAPEQQCQLGDMKIECPEPIWTVEDTELYEQQWESTLGDKPPSKEKRREFAKRNLGNMGRRNLTGSPLSSYYPGTAHLGFRSAETVCLRIAKVATGLYKCLNLFKGRHEAPLYTK